MLLKCAIHVDQEWIFLFRRSQQNWFQKELVEDQRIPHFEKLQFSILKNVL